MPQKRGSRSGRIVRTVGDLLRGVEDEIATEAVLRKRALLKELLRERNAARAVLRRIEGNLRAFLAQPVCDEGTDD